MGAFIDLTGETFHRLTVVSRAEKRGRRSLWLCRCECGKEITTDSDKLRSGHTKSCGCFQKDRVSELRSTDLTGQKFGRWTVVGTDKREYGKHTRYICKCECGTEKSVSGPSLKIGSSLSCGCLQKERIVSALTKHGHTCLTGTTSTYNIWRSMNQRCYNKNSRPYKDYGGRGISVCERWRDGFVNFLSDMGERPDNMQLDRIDNDGNYEPGNCRWVTQKENNQNKRSNHHITAFGEKKLISEWSDISGINRETIRLRIEALGWSPEDALRTPVKIRKSNTTKESMVRPLKKEVYDVFGK